MMKNTYFLSAIALPLLSMGQTCHEANDSFTAMANDKDFVEAHELPASVQVEMKGAWITYEAEGGDARGYEVLAETETDKWLLVFHEWWGLNDNIIREADEWAEELGVNVLAIDMYDGKIGTTREAAGELMQQADADRIQAIIEGAFEHIGEEAHVGTIGWCFGGGWSLQTALIGNDQVDACVMYYGMPEKDVDRLSTLNAPVLGIFASQDQWINKEVVSEFEENMKAAEKDLTVHSYDAAHAFANPSNEDVYNEEAAVDAREKSLNFFRENLL